MLAGIAALGGLLFGYDTGIISSALISIKKDFPVSDGMQQGIVASLLVGAVIGVACGGTMADRVGRKRTLSILSVGFAVFAVISALSPNIPFMLVTRFLLGIAIGASSVTVPAYIAEIAPPRTRGKLVSFQQLMIATGLLLAYFVGYLFTPSGQWRWMIALGAVPAIVMAIGLFRLPESPRWLITKGRRQEATRVLQLVVPAHQVEAEEKGILDAIEADRGISVRKLFTPTFRPALILGIVVAATNQLAGVNAVQYYSPTMLQRAGFGDSAAVLSSVGIGAANLVFAIVSVVLLDRIGRRKIFLTGIAGVVLSLVGLGLVYKFTDLSGGAGVALLVLLIVYQGFFAASLGIAIWLVNSEIFPTAVRGKALGFGTGVHWGLDLIISATTLTLINAMGAHGMFWMFAVLAFLGFVYLFRNLPETAGRTLEEVQADLQRRPVRK